MLKLDGYKINSLIYESSNTSVYRGLREEDKNPVILKFLKKEYPTPHELKQFEYEYNTTRSISHINGVIKTFDIRKYKNSRVIIMEDIQGNSLNRILDKSKINIKSFLIIAIKVAEILGEIHKSHIIHKDIKPHNIIINLDNNEVRIIDFSISTQLTKENQGIIKPENIEGTIIYISPEQTGRMNRPIDYRTDYYSLGVTFYQMLTGVPPFNSDDPLEVIHSHIAKMPKSPSEIDKNIPEPVSKIIMKLLNKNSEDRYQSIMGITTDLKFCYKQIKEKGKINDFKLAQKDISDKFCIPDKLYGRENELKIIDEKYNITSDNKQILLLAGPPGIGKSAIINEAKRPIVQKNGYFIEGKFDKFKRNIPYTAINQAFSSLARQLLTLNDDQINEWKNKIIQAAGSIGQVIIDVIPDLELIIGKQQEVQKLPAAEAQNRFNMLFQNFIKLFAKKAHPLVIFIDDLQWADNASLNLIDKLLEDVELKNFMFIGSYRDNEIDSSHPLNSIIKKLNKMKENYESLFENINISPLKNENIASMLIDILYINDNKIVELAKLLQAKTGGNPFFVIEFLKHLADEELIIFDKEWKWDIKKIKSSGVTDNVIDLMTDKIKKLPEDSLEILKTSACIGVRFYMDRLTEISEKSEDEIFNLLIPPINEGMIIKTAEHYNFVHDKVREAAYSLLSKNERKKHHYNIGKNILTKTKKEEIDEQVFNITSQLNRAKDLLDENEKLELIKLNLTAGRKAKASAAFDAALDFFKEGISLLKNDSWKNQYEITFKIFTEKAECEYLTGNYEEAEKDYEIILKKAKNVIDRAKIHSLQIVHYTTLEKRNKALTIARKSLKKLKVSIPKKGLLPLLIKEVITTKMKLGKMDISNILNYKELDNNKIITTMKLLLTASSTAYFVDANLMSIMFLKILKLSIKHGIGPLTAQGVAGFGLLNCGALGDPVTGNQFGEAALKIIEKYNASMLLCKINFLYSAFIKTWKNNIIDSIKSLEKSIKFGIENGDFEYIQYTINICSLLGFITGKNFIDQTNEINERLNIIKYIGQQSSIVTYMVYDTIQIINNDTNLSENDLLTIKGKYFDETKELEKYKEENNLTVIASFYYLKLHLFFLYEYYDKAYELINISNNIEAGFFSLPLIPQFYFLLFLCISLNYNNLSKKEKKKKYKLLINIKKKFKKWSNDCPENYQGQLHIINAEISKINKDYINTQYLYEESIKHTKQLGFLNITAIANECAAKYYMSIGLETNAKTYIIEAKNLYNQWGAFSKVKLLEKKYPEFFESLYNVDKNDSKMNKTISMTDSTSKKKGTSGTTFLDIETVFKANYAISSEIEMKGLLTNLIKIVIENAGAQKGILLLKDNDKNDYLVEAKGEINKDEVIVLQGTPIADTKDLSPGIIRYTLKTKEYVVLNNAAVEGMFTKDPYVIKNKPKSILCLPIIKQNEIIGLLYLENNITKYAFTKERIEILNILSTQIAISIENSKLIENLKEKERLKKEMEIAERIQTSLCPPAPEHPELELSAVMKPADEVGGDYYDIIFDNNNDLWFAIGDVSGHGVTPGLIMMMAETAFNSYVKGPDNMKPKEVISEVNKILLENIKTRLHEHHFMTMNFLKYTGKGNFTHSGLHEDIIIYRNKSKKCEKIETKGIYLGLKANFKQEVFVDSDISLEQNDIMVLYTDGVIEAKNKEDKLWDHNGIIEILMENNKKNLIEIQNLILNRALDWCNNKIADDMTMILIRKK